MVDLIDSIIAQQLRQVLSSLIKKNLPKLVSEQRRVVRPAAIEMLLIDRIT